MFGAGNSALGTKFRGGIAVGLGGGRAGGSSTDGPSAGCSMDCVVFSAVVSVGGAWASAVLPPAWCGVGVLCPLPSPPPAVGIAVTPKPPNRHSKVKATISRMSINTQVPDGRSCSSSCCSFGCGGGDSWVMFYPGENMI